jgi:hypothetical protein
MDLIEEDARCDFIVYDIVDKPVGNMIFEIIEKTSLDIQAAARQTFYAEMVLGDLDPLIGQISAEMRKHDYALP